MTSESKTAEIELGDHLCMIYDDEREKLYTEILFIADGLKNDELVILLNEDEEELISILSQIVDVRRFLDKKQLIFLSKDESYLRDGFFDVDRMLEDIAELDEKALAEGYRGLRLVGDASWVLSYPKAERFLEFETKLNKLLPLTRCIVLCLFDERKFNPDFLLKALQVHPKLIAGKEVKENLNYVPPEAFLKKLKTNMRSVQSMQNLQKLIDRKLEREFGEMEEKFKMLFESSFEAVIIFKGERVVSCNPKAMEILGIKNFRQVLGKSVYDLFGYEIKSRIEAAKAEPQFFELSLSRDERKIELEASLTKVSDKLMMIARDITERKETERKLKESEQRYRLLVESSIDAIITINSKAKILTWNKGAERIYGYKAEEVIGKPLTMLMPERYRERFIQGFSLFKSVFKPRLEFDYPQGRVREAIGLRKNGEEFPTEVSYYVWRSGEEIFFTSIVRDVSEKKRLEEALKESEELFRKLAEKSLVGIYLIQDGVFKYVNPKMSELWGYSVEELIGRSSLDFIHPEDKELVRRNLEARIKGEIESISYRFRVVRKNGEIRYNDVYGSRIIYKGKPAVIGTLLDVTEKIKLEKARLEAFRQIEKNIENYAILVDHIRNPLAAILGLAEMEIKDDELRKKFETLVYRIEEIVEKLDKGWLESETVRKFLRGELRG
jgi:PAS domain S-box-containing protein